MGENQQIGHPNCGGMRGYTPRIEGAQACAECVQRGLILGDSIPRDRIWMGFQF